MAKSKAVARALVIVESPAKAKTINKYLGDEYVVKASMGHVRDLPPREFGIDLENGFAPTYEVLRGRSKVVSELRKASETAHEVYLATDLDREGEAIAWHLAQALNLPPGKAKRVIFNEITASAIREAFSHPHDLDLDRVNAQQARRILDRIVGYELSPLLWKKIAKGLSAGRVQSVAVRLIVDREREIRAFVPVESWKLTADFCGDVGATEAVREAWGEFSKAERTQKEIGRWLSEHGAFRAELVEIGGKPVEPGSAEDAARIAASLGLNVERIERQAWREYAHLGLEQARIVGRFDATRAPRFTIAGLATRRTTTRPPAPFTTASLQQAASTNLRFSASRTMRVAQGLYEGVDLAGEGPVGLITYMRTDSTHLSKESLHAVREFIRREFGEAYLPESPNFFGKRQERAQEAHEAVRPTDPARTPASVRERLTDEQYRLYELIWQRFVACQMPPAQWDSTSVSVSCETPLGAARLAGNGRKLVFDGFMRVSGVTSEDQILPPLKEGQPVGAVSLDARQQFSSPPARYTEASLVKALESEGIGRPSTYAAIIDTIQERGYVDQEDRKFVPTALGETVTDKLVEHFPKIMDVKFTSYMEDELDKIEEAHLDWVSVLHEFYDPFRELLAKATEEMHAVRAQPSDVSCPECGKAMVYRWARTGRFLACSGYPACKATMNVTRDGQPIVPKLSGVTCEACGKPMVHKQARGGHFLGCSGYPECRTTRACDENGEPLRIVKDEEVRRPCEACGVGTMVVKRKGRRAFLACDRYPACRATGSIPADVALERKAAPPPEPAGVNCEKCGRAMVIRLGSRGRFISCSGFPRCRNAKPIEKLEALRAAAAARGESAGDGVAGPGNPGDGAAEAREGRESAAGGRRSAARAAVTEATAPAGYALTRTGKPVVEVMPTEGELQCPECGGVMELRRGRFGPFFACGSFPRCRFVANLRGEAKKVAEELMPAPARPKPEPTDIPCEECGKPMLIREGRRGKFLGCSGYPKCRSTKELPAGVGV